jgi:hypothetical protein
MPTFLLHHRHAADKCGVAFAAFKGQDSKLRHEPAIASCAAGGHEIWWIVEAASEADALSQLPYYIAVRSTATAVRAVRIP